MKKLNLFFMVVLFFCGSINSFANVKNYTFTQSAGSYVPITGGTVVATATSLSGEGSLDNVIYTFPNGTIPFTFRYDGTGYTGFSISSNGFITFGGAPLNTNFTPISTAAGGYSGAISAFGGDNNSLFDILGNTGEIRYQTLGTGSTQQFVIQFKNFRPLSTSSSTTIFWRWNFQIRLHINGLIAIIYDANFAGAPAAFTRQLGLRGPDATFATNVNNRLITNGTHTWATSINGTANTSTCGASTTNIPSSGRTYSWTPQLILEAFLPGQGCPEDITVEFRNAANPNTNLIAPQVVSLPVNGAPIVSLGNITNGTGAYIVVKHRNSLETWSKLVTITAGNTYSFRSAVTYAYCDNQYLFNNIPAIHRGDFNQDGVIDVEDVNRCENDAYNFVTGNVVTDLDCNGVVDFFDLYTMSLLYYPIIVSNPSFLINPPAYVNRPLDPSPAYPKYCDVKP